MTNTPIYADNTTVHGDGTEEHPLSSSGGGGSPGGANTTIQINDGGTFNGFDGTGATTDQLTYDKVARVISLQAGPGDDGIFIGGGSIAIVTNGDTIDIDPSTGSLAFFGAVGIPKPTVTGSRGGNAALASLLTALADFGLLTDSTTP